MRPQQSWPNDLTLSDQRGHSPKALDGTSNIEKCVHEPFRLFNPGLLVSEVCFLPNDRCTCGRMGTLFPRETKTINREPGFTTAEQALDVYPQIALSVCLLADDPDISDGVVELEILTNGAGYLYTFDASDAHVVLAARRHLAEVLDTWLHDDTHAPPEDPPCHWCPMRHVCPDSQADGETPRRPTSVDITSSVLADPEFVQELANDSQDDDEDIPF